MLFVRNNLIWFSNSAITADIMFPHKWNKKNGAMERKVMHFIQQYRYYLHWRCYHLWLFICLLSEALLFLLLTPLLIRKTQYIQRVKDARNAWQNPLTLPHSPANPLYADDLWRLTTGTELRELGSGGKRGCVLDPDSFVSKSCIRKRADSWFTLCLCYSHKQWLSLIDFLYLLWTKRCHG